MLRFILNEGFLMDFLPLPSLVIDAALRFLGKWEWVLLRFESMDLNFEMFFKRYS